MSDGQPGKAPWFRLKEWRGGGWVVVAVSDSASALGNQARTLYAEGTQGDAWTIDCECGGTSTFYGCRSKAHD